MHFNEQEAQMSSIRFLIIAVVAILALAGVAAAEPPLVIL
jgi:hypothetical protein